MADLAYRPDGAAIATLCNEPGAFTCRIVDSETGRLLQAIKLPAAGEGVAWSPDGKTLATACDGSKDLRLGCRLPPAKGCPRRCDQYWPSCVVSPLGHPSGRQRMGKPTPVVGPDPGPPHAQLDRPCVGLADRHFSRMARLPSPASTLLPYTRSIRPSNTGPWPARPASRLNSPRPAVRNDGRVLAVATDRGVVALGHGSQCRAGLTGDRGDLVRAF